MHATFFIFVPITLSRGREPPHVLQALSELTNFESFHENISNGFKGNSRLMSWDLEIGRVTVIL